MNEPIADKVRGTLDGHIVLNRAWAQSYHFPAIDVLQSVSRLGRRVTGIQTRKACGIIRQLMSTYQENETLINTGNYEAGRSASIDKAIEKHELIEEFLKQEEYEKCSMEESLKKLSELSEIEIPQEEYAEDSGTKILTTAQIADAAAKKDNL